MRAVTVRVAGGPEALQVETVPSRPPGPGQVAVDVAACGVNFIDVYHRSGQYLVPLPFVPGLEGAGVVAEVGAGAEHVRVGDRVAWADAAGSYADQAIVAADRLIPVPDEVPLPDAAALTLQGLTAHYLAHDSYRIRAGDTVLVHAAAGGVGLLLVQVATSIGARVIGAVSTAEKARAARDAGASEVVLYGRHDLVEQVRSLSHGEGVAAVYDGIGRETFDASLSVLRPRGTLVLFGQSSGTVPAVDPQRLNSAGSVFLTRPNLVHHIATRRELLNRAGDLFAWLIAGQVAPHVHRTFALEAASSAHQALERRETIGKLLLLP
ncbi:quinone oxidoreductase family protein [Micromonospora sp. NPDC051227]|uniref:quinone oxidoreductase family protein n=1 Tax=Micromonospora sp. NPDC051227 TaxID=3364285 RepID=UPI00378F7CE4